MVVRIVSDVISGGGVSYIMLGPSFCMAMFVKYVVFRSPVYSASLLGSFDDTWSWLVRQHVVASVVGIFTGCG